MCKTNAVLIADDEESFLLPTAELLRRDGYTCDCARDGLQAGELIRSRYYDLLIADIGMTGNERLELVRNAQQVAPGMAVILVTGYPSLTTAIDSVGLPVTAYLTKPIAYGDLRVHVETATARSEARRTLSGVRDRLRDCVRELDGRFDANGTDKISTELCPMSLLRTLASCLSELLSLRARATGGQRQPKLCELLDCPMYPLERESIGDAIEVLKRTKSSFKSKELAELRLRLERLS